jgi:hypothetical protein
MLRPRLGFLLALSVFAGAAAYAVAADQPPAAQGSQDAVPAPGKEPARKPAAAVPPPAAPEDPRQTAPAGGVVVFIDPATGKIRQPDASEIGGLAPSLPMGSSVVSKAPEAALPALIQGPGGAVGARLGEDSLTYMVVTTTPAGQLAMDCVTGGTAAAARVTAGPAPPAKETSAGPARTQDTHDVKLPR